MKPPLIDCPRCGGKGAVILGPELFQTLESVMRLKRATATELWMNSPRTCKVTAFNNRLNDLLKLGFVKRIRESKTWVYSPAK